jgi:glycosyltransferase involved in cell wall biosynthesis
MINKNCKENRSLGKVAVIHPHIWQGGGSEVSAIWMLEALKNLYHVCFISTEVPSLENLNEWCGTHLLANEIQIIKIQIPLLLKLFPKKLSALRAYRLFRYCKRIAPDFDLMIYTYGLMDFGRKGIQYIQDFSFDDQLRSEFDSSISKERKIFYKPSPWRKLYLSLGRKLSRISVDSFRKNLTIANSRWCSKVLAQRMNLRARVVYPPVPGEYRTIPWEEKENGFVYLGRITPEKRVELIIEALKEVKKTYPFIHLHIAGRADNSKYLKHIKRLCDENSDWAYFEGIKLGLAKDDLLREHKYGFFARENEPFGIAIVEMIKAGCIVWVPDSGGQVEIVNHPALIYKNRNEAVLKISLVLHRADLQNLLRQHLAQQASGFSIEKFSSDVRKIVRQGLSGRDSGHEFPSMP